MDIQNYLTMNTWDFTLSVWDLADNPCFLVSHNVDLTLLYFTAPVVDILQTDLYTLSLSLLRDIHEITKPKTYTEGMVRKIPEHQSTLELFEVLSVNVDNSLYQFLHLPDTKLYYPEPYVASPSFNHEELWFIHILYYQHWL